MADRTGIKRTSTLFTPSQKRQCNDNLDSDRGDDADDEDDMVLCVAAHPSTPQDKAKALLEKRVYAGQDIPISDSPLVELLANTNVQQNLAKDASQVRTFRAPEIDADSPTTDPIHLFLFIQRTGTTNETDRSACVEMIGRYMWRNLGIALLSRVKEEAIRCRSFFINPCNGSLAFPCARRRFVVAAPLTPNVAAELRTLRVNMCCCGAHSNASRWSESKNVDASIVISGVEFVHQILFVMNVLWAESPQQVFFAIEQSNLYWPPVAAAAAANAGAASASKRKHKR